ncbi:MAG: ATP-binding protein [Bacteroidales bacterium]
MPVIFSRLILIFILVALPVESFASEDSLQVRFFSRLENGIYEQSDRYTLDEIALLSSLQDHQKGISIIYEALALAILHNMDTLRFDCHRTLGHLYSQIGIADRAIENSLLAKNFYARINETGNYNWTVINIGNSYYWQGSYWRAIDYYEEALAGFELMKNSNPEDSDVGSDGMAVALNNIALCNIKAEEYNAAIEYHLRALELRKASGSKTLIAHTYGYLGFPYSLMGNNDMALEYYYRALDILSDTTGLSAGDVPFSNNTRAFINRRIGLHYGNNNDPVKAANYYLLSINDYARLNNQKELINTYLSMADTYLKTGQTSNALPSAFKALELATEDEYLADKIMAYEKIVTIYTSLGDYQKALGYSQKIIKTDSLLYRNFNDLVLLGVEKDIAHRLQTEDIQVLRREKLINEMNISRQKTAIVFLIITSFLILIILFVFFYFFNQKRKTNRKLQELNSQMHQINKKLHNSETKLARKNINLEKSEKMLKELNLTKDKFFSIVAHDLRSPIANIMQVTELLCYKFDEMADVKKRAFLSELQKTTEGLYNLLETLLQWSQSQQGIVKFNPENIDIGEVAEKNIKIFNLLAKNKKIKIVSSGVKNVYAFADLNMIDTIYRNLISNAIKFSPEGETIRVEILEKAMEISISVIDSGIGMTDEVLSNIFSLDKKESVKGTAGEKGTGLGLVICKEFIEMHGGNITAESIPEKGSTFTVTLPGLNLDEKKVYPAKFLKNPA